MLDLKLTSNGDLDCTELGVHLIDDAPRVAQQVQTCLRTFLGEWEFDLEAGVPWFQRILGMKIVNLNDVDNVLRTAILAVDDVVSILEFSMTLNTSTRNLSINSKINTTFGVVQVEGTFP